MRIIYNFLTSFYNLYTKEFKNRENLVALIKYSNELAAANSKAAIFICFSIFSNN